MEPPRNNVADFESGRLARTLLDAEKFARDQAPKTEAFTVEVSQKTRTVTLFDCDGAGRRMSDIVGFFSLDVGVMAKNDGQAQTAHHHELFLRDDLDYKEIAARVAREASGMLNSGACASGRYKAVIRNSAFAELFGAFLPSFFAEKCQNKMSFLTGMLNSPIGSRAFSAYEDPAGLIRRRFDDEGTLTERKTIVDKGRLSDYFHNARTAALDPGKRKSNGNGFRQNYNEGISSAYTNVVVEGAQKTLAGLLSGMDEGLLVTECDGIFAGINPASGDFSVLAKGYMVKGGGLSRPVSGITIGGNLVDLLSAVEETGSDYIVIQSNTGVVKSPSARLSGIVVTGA
ncbi:MAG: TldD/PmbA family protein [Treponema sp.]|nr:TldD/PmbA family protein [Treponema sp.]